MRIKVTNKGLRHVEEWLGGRGFQALPLEYRILSFLAMLGSTSISVFLLMIGEEETGLIREVIDSLIEEGYIERS